MNLLSNLKNTHRSKKARKLLGRGIGSGKGKTCGRGHKGAGSRAGYKRRWGYEGGQMRLYMKLPARGFSNVRFAVPVEAVNLYQIEQSYENGETVNLESLKQKGLITNGCKRLKLLGDGEITKKIKIEVHLASGSAQEKAKNSLTLIG